jgi:zinc/manganese transport system permease protein
LIPAHWAAQGSGVPLTWNLVQDIRQLFEFHFMVNAFRAGTVVAVAAGLLGWFMVLREQSFAGHTLAVAGFPGAAGATLIGVNPAWGFFAFCGAGAAIIAAVPRARAGAEGAGFSEESAAIGTVQALALACGFLFVSLYHGFLNGINALLFGTFLGITDAQVWVLVAVAAVILVALAIGGRPLLFASADPDVAAARGVPVTALGAAFLLLLGFAAAEASQITGSLLVFALLVIPGATAQRLSSRPAVSIPLSVAIALGVTWLGLAAAYYSDYPIGFFVTTFGFAAFALARFAPRIRLRAASVITPGALRGQRA